MEDQPNDPLNGNPNNASWGNPGAGNPNNALPGTNVIQPPIAMAPPQSGQDAAIAQARMASAAMAAGLPPVQPNHPVAQRQRAAQAAAAGQRRGPAPTPHQRALAQQAAQQATQQQVAQYYEQQGGQSGNFLTVATDGRQDGVELLLAPVDGEGIHGFVLVARNGIGALALTFVPAPV